MAENTYQGLNLKEGVASALASRLASSSLVGGCTVGVVELPNQGPTATHRWWDSPISSGFYVSYGEAFESKGLDIAAATKWVEGVFEENRGKVDEEGRPAFFLLGSWLDTNTGIIYIDRTVHFDRLVDAVKFAADNNQLAIWDIRNAVAVYL